MTPHLHFPYQSQQRKMSSAWKVDTIITVATYSQSENDLKNNPQPH
jgi:hypothetical protein